MSHIVHVQLGGPGGLDRKILLTRYADCICAPCSWRVGMKCREQERIERIEAAHCKILGIEGREIMTWGECVERVRTRVVPDDLDRICAGCPWLPSGKCKAAVAKLVGQTEKAGPDAPAPPFL